MAVFTNKSVRSTQIQVNADKWSLGNIPFLGLFLEVSTVLIYNTHNLVLFCIYFVEINNFYSAGLCLKTTAPKYDVIFWQENVSYT